MGPTYSVKDWDQYFETAESRKLRSTRWVPVPNKHDGKGYRRVTQHPQAVQIFCAWNLILQVASKMPIRGVLADRDGPLETEDLSAKTGYPAAIFQTAFDFLSGPSIGWLIRDDQQSAPELQQAPPEIRHHAADTAACHSGSSSEGKRKRHEEKTTKGIESKDELDSNGRSRIHRQFDLCNEEFLKQLQQNPAYQNLNVHHVFEKLAAWCEMHGEKPTRRRLLSWLNREEPRKEAHGTYLSKPETASQRNVRNLKAGLNYLNSLSEDGGKDNLEGETSLLGS